MDLNQEFFSLPPNLNMRLCDLYNSYFSGSSLWKLESQEAKLLYAAWNKYIKVNFNLPWATHCWILEEDQQALLEVSAGNCGYGCQFRHWL